MANFRQRIRNRRTTNTNNPDPVRKYLEIASASQVHELPKLIAAAIREARAAEVHGRVLSELGNRPSRQVINRPN